MLNHSIFDKNKPLKSCVVLPGQSLFISMGKKCSAFLALVPCCISLGLFSAWMGVSAGGRGGDSAGLQSSCSALRSGFVAENMNTEEGLEGICCLVENALCSKRLRARSASVIPTETKKTEYRLSGDDNSHSKEFFNLAGEEQIAGCFKQCFKVIKHWNNVARDTDNSSSYKTVP